MLLIRRRNLFRLFGDPEAHEEDLEDIIGFRKPKRNIEIYMIYLRCARSERGTKVSKVSEPCNGQLFRTVRRALQ